MRNRETESCYH